MKNKANLSNIRLDIKNNSILFVIALLFLCTGIVLGIYTVKYMGSFEKSDLCNYIASFFKNIQTLNKSNKVVFLQALKNNIPLICGIWFLGFTIVGIPIILLVDLVKGFTIGFTTSFIISGLGNKGILVTTFTVLPQNLIYIPCIIISSVIAMEYSLFLLKKNKIRQINSESFWTKIIFYSSKQIIIILFMFIGFFWEGYLTPNIVRLIIEKTGYLMI